MKPTSGIINKCRVEDLGVVVLREGPALRVPPAAHDLLVDPVPFADPAGEVSWPPVLHGEADHTVEGDPAHQPAVCEVLPAAAGLPDPFVGLIPVIAHPVRDLTELDPPGVSDSQAAAVGEPDRVQQLAVDVQLKLVSGAVADPYRTGVRVTRPGFEDLLRQVGGAIDPVHDLQRPGILARLLGDALFSHRTNASASSVKPRPSSACTENEPSRTQV